MQILAFLSQLHQYLRKLVLREDYSRNTRHVYSLLIQTLNITAGERDNSNRHYHSQARNRDVWN